MIKKKKCSDCKKYFPENSDFFYKSKNNKLQSSCKKCHGIKCKSYGYSREVIYKKASKDLKVSRRSPCGMIRQKKACGPVKNISLSQYLIEKGKK